MNKQIRLLYYSNALIANHGGRLHSEAFVKEASRNDKVKEIIPYPMPTGKMVGAKPSPTSFLRKKFKKIGFLQVFFFYKRNKSSFNTVVSVIEKNEIDAIHIRVDSNFLIIEQLRKKFPRLIITTEVNASPFDENLENILFKKYFKKTERQSLEKADANFFVSGFLRESIIQDFDSKRDYVVHNGVDMELFAADNNLIKREENDRLTFGYVGTLDYHKNLKILLNAFKKVHSKFSGEVKLLIVGDGPMYEELQAYIMEINLQAMVEFAGWVQHKDISSYLDRMDIAIHHSANPYMSPLKLFEYMAKGLPVIGPNTPGVKELFEDGKDLIMVKCEVDALADKMEFLVKNENKRKEIAQNGKDKVLRDYTWSANVEKIVSIIQKKVNEDY